MLPHPLPIRIQSGAMPVCPDEVLLIGDVQDARGRVAGSVSPLLEFGVAVSKGEAIATRMIVGRDIGILGLSQIALQITVVQGVHRLIAKDPDIGYADTIKLGHLREELPAVYHTNHIRNDIRRHVDQVPYHRGIHRDAANPGAIV